MFIAIITKQLENPPRCNGIRFRMALEQDNRFVIADRIPQAHERLKFMSFDIDFDQSEVGNIILCENSIASADTERHSPAGFCFVWKVDAVQELQLA